MIYHDPILFVALALPALGLGLGLLALVVWLTS